jgi:hypothetical protein
MRKTILSTVATTTLVAAIGILALQSEAEAAPTTVSCNVNNIVWDGRLFVDCSNTSTRFIAYPGTSACATSAPGTQKTIDDLKVFESMASAALLSGKTLSITSEPNCDGSGNGGIYTLQLNQ